MPNLYGDIISDLCAGLIGGLGLTPRYLSVVSIIEGLYILLINPSDPFHSAVILVRVALLWQRLCMVQPLI